MVLFSLPGREYVEAVMEGEDGVLAGLTEETVVVDTGTTPPDADRLYDRLCRERDAGYVDAGLTLGGPGDYENGSGMNFFVGGRVDDYERARPVIEAISHDHRHYGGVGMGHVVKAGHRMLQNLSAQVEMEFFEYLRNNDVNPWTFDDHMGVGFDDRMERDVYPSARGFEAAVWDGEDGREEDDTPHFDAVDESGDGVRLRTSHWMKDPAYAIAIAHATNTYTPLLSTGYQTQLAAQNYAEAMFDRELVFQDDDFFDRGDTAAVYRLLNRPAEEWDRLRRTADADGE